MRVKPCRCLIDVVVVDAYPSDAPFNLCAGLTYTNGTARLSCSAQSTGGNQARQAACDAFAEWARPINNPNRPPEYLPVSGAPIDLLGPIALLGGMALLGLAWSRRKVR